MKSITLVTPSLSNGGAERVISILANSYAEEGIETTLIILTKKAHFYKISDKVKIIEPKVKVSQMGKGLYMFWSILWLRKKIKMTNSDTLLSFSGKYNSFVILASLGLNKKVFVSDRSRPGISYGKLLDFLNPRVYRWAEGIIAQTEKAKEFMARTTQHENIQIIGNPIHQNEGSQTYKKENIILNVGRFIPSKHQDEMIRYFDALDLKDWKLIFLGDGPNFEKCKKVAQTAKNKKNIQFLGKVKNVEDFYKKAKIFAFTSTSEGFPNVLGEAISYQCIPISYDCVAGPSDLIKDNKNGFLITEKDHDEYQKKLLHLVNNYDKLYPTFSAHGDAIIKDFSKNIIVDKFKKFLKNDLF